MTRPILGHKIRSQATQTAFNLYENWTRIQEYKQDINLNRIKINWIIGKLWYFFVF